MIGEFEGTGVQEPGVRNTGVRSQKQTSRNSYAKLRRGSLDAFPNSLEVSPTEIIPDPESGDPHHVIKDRAAQRNESPALGLGKNAQQAGDLDATADRHPTAASFINQQERGPQFRCDENRLGLALVEIAPQKGQLIGSCAATTRVQAGSNSTAFLASSAATARGMTISP